MNKESMTAFVCAFARAYHGIVNEVTVFNDYLTKELLSDEEWSQAVSHMTKGIEYFEPKFCGTNTEKLERVMNHYISPTILGRSAYAEKMLQNAITLGVDQYLIFGAGYDTFGLRKPKWANELRIIELDHPLTTKEKIKKLKKRENDDWTRNKNYYFEPVDFSQEHWQKKLLEDSCIKAEKISFCSLLGLTYYLTKDTFEEILEWIGQTLPEGTSLVFDYPDQQYYSIDAEDRTKKQVAMAKMAGEEMCTGYAVQELILMMEKAGIQLYEHLETEDINHQFFETYNLANPSSPIRAPRNVQYCLGVVKGKKLHT